MRQENVRRLISIGLLLILLIVFGFTTDNFFSGANLLNILRECSVIGIIAIGATMVIITGGIDLSTGANLGISAMICARLLYYYQLPSPAIIVLALLIGTLVGFLNGILVAHFRLPDFIATLSTQFIFRALMLITAIKEDGSIVNKVIKDRGILVWGGSINGVYLVTIAFILLAILGQLFLKCTKPGVYIYATGANRKSADLSGINTARVKVAVFAITGFLCGIGALFTMGRVGSVTTDTGTGFEFDAISAAVIGGCALSGGRGDVMGSVIGAIFMAVLQNGIYKYNVPTATQLIVKGVVIVLMVIFDSVYDQHQQRQIMEKARQDEERLVGGEV